MFSRRFFLGMMVALAMTAFVGRLTEVAAADSSVRGVSAGAGADAPTVVTSGLKAPWSIAFYGKTPLVSERDSARILAIGPDGENATVATIAGVDPRGEGGLLGIAVHGGYLYTYFTSDKDNRIDRYKINSKDGRIALGTAEKVIQGIPAARYHNGGRIAFGPDGMLYATTGDAGQRERAQDLKSLAGKILRMTPDGQVPKDNPYPGSYVYSYGHRNVQGLAWSRDGVLYASEFGENTWDELNRIQPRGNYGWPVVEGKSDKKDAAGKPAYIDPLQQWPTASASPSGMTIIGNYIYLASLRGERLRKIALASPQTSEELFVRQYGRLRDAVEAPDGSLWILTNNTDGRGQARPGDDHILRLNVK